MILSFGQHGSQQGSQQDGGQQGGGQQGAGRAQGIAKLAGLINAEAFAKLTRSARLAVLARETFVASRPSLESLADGSLEAAIVFTTVACLTLAHRSNRHLHGGFGRGDRRWVVRRRLLGAANGHSDREHGEPQKNSTHGLFLLKARINGSASILGAN